MRKKIRERLENIVKEYTGKLSLFAMYFFQDVSAVNGIAQECLVPFMELLKKDPAAVKPEMEKAYLYKAVREKCFEKLSSEGRKYEAGQGAFILLPSFENLEEGEKEILLLHNGSGLDFEQISYVMDRKDAEEIYFLALMKLAALEKENAAENMTQTEILLMLEEKITAFFAAEAEKFSCDPFMEEKLLAFAASFPAPDHKKILVRLFCILIFCVFTVSIFMYSSYRSRPELTPEVRVGVLMDKEELKANLLKEKKRQEMIKKEMLKKGISRIRIRAVNLEGVRKMDKPDGKIAEKILKERAGLDVKIYRAEFDDKDCKYVCLYVSPADSVKILRCEKIIK
ncbi:MAG: hypothetical protein IKC08_03515 [Lentisphaeria bacterium]|nr:hypothetical protein [Lentisphaeria bacterium]